MSAIEFDVAGRPIFVLPLHFDVTGHKLALDTFVSTSIQYENLIAAFNREVFSGQLQYKIYVLPPESGSFKSKMGVVIIAGFGALTATIMGDFGQGFVKGLTEKTPVEWGEELGESLRDQLSSSADIEVEEEQVENAIASRILVETSRGFLEKQSIDLEDIDITPESFPEAFVAKNDFYNALELNPQVDGVGFSDEPEMPIRREHFGQRIKTVRTEDLETWRFETTKFLVTSPNWDRRDKQRGWKGRDANETIVYFTISDPEFWRMFSQGDIKSNAIDELIVQVASCFEKGRLKKRVVLNVISYNGESVSREVDDSELKTRLEALGVTYFSDDDPDLFEVDSQ